MTNSILHSMGGSPATEDPDRLARRLIQKAHNRDGVPEIAVGICLLLLAGITALQLKLAHGLLLHGSLLRGVVSMALVLLGFPAIGFAWGPAIKWVRNRWLIERTGYVEMKPPSTTRRVLGLSIAMFVAMIVAAAVAAEIRAHIASPRQWILPGTGVLYGALFPVCGRSLRFVFNGAVVAVTGILLGVYNVRYGTGWMVLYGVAGAITVISGLVVLIRYLRQTPDAGD